MDDKQVFGFPIKTMPQGEIDRETMKSKRIELIGGFVFGHRDGHIYVSEPKE